MKTLYSLILILTFPTVSISAQEQTAIIPSNYSTTPGEGAQAPFVGLGVRTQNIFSSDHLEALMPDGAMITAIGLRMDERVRGSYMGTADLEVRMSTTPSLKPILTLEFAKNIGEDYRTVFPAGTLAYSIDNAESGLNPFHFKIPVTGGFLYEPTKGGLLVEFISRGSATTGLTIDGFNPVDEAALSISGNVANASGRILTPFVLELSFMPIPEPNIGLLLLFGIGSMFITRRFQWD